MSPEPDVEPSATVAAAVPAPRAADIAPGENASAGPRDADAAAVPRDAATAGPRDAAAGPPDADAAAGSSAVEALDVVGAAGGGSAIVAPDDDGPAGDGSAGGVDDDGSAGGSAAGVDGGVAAAGGQGSGGDLAAEVRVRFRDGDPEALGAAYDRYGRAVWAVAMSATRAEHLAEEATQETFIRAWNAAATYDPARSLGPWLLTIARYTALDVLRRELRPTRGGHEAETDAVIEPPGIDRAWLSWTVQEALRRLAPDDRELVRLAFYEDLTQTQIAERLEVPVGTVKSRSHRVYRRLATLLAHVRDEPEAGPAVNRPGPAARTPGRSPTAGAPPQDRTDAGERRRQR